MWKWMDVFMSIAEIYHRKFGQIPGWQGKPVV
jgi:hypothetical protein